VSFEQQSEPKFEVVVLASAPPETTFKAILDYQQTFYWHRTTEINILRCCARVLVAIRWSWACFEA